MNRSFVLQRSSASGAAVASWILPGVRVLLGTEQRDRCEQASRRGESCSQCSQHLSCSPAPPAPSKSLLPPPQGGLSWPRRAVGSRQKDACGSAAGSRCSSERGTGLGAAGTVAENPARVSALEPQLEMLLGVQKGEHWCFPLLSKANPALEELFPRGRLSMLTATCWISH